MLSKLHRPCCATSNKVTHPLRHSRPSSTHHRASTIEGSPVSTLAVFAAMDRLIRVLGEPRAGLHFCLNH